MKKSPLNFGAFQIASRLFGRGGGNRSGGGLDNRVRRLERLMAEIRGEKTGSGTDDSIKSVQDNLINPPSADMIGNIQPMGYNETGFSNEMVRNSEQIFNTPEERNKII